MRVHRRWGRAATTGAAVLIAVVATVFNCASNAKTSAGPKIKNVAVVETEVDAESDASAQLNRAEVRQVTTVLRKEAVENLPHGKYNIMTTETVMSQGSAVLEECSDENCVIKVGAAIGADYIVRGTVSKLGTMLTVSVDIYETNDGNLVASSELVRSENIVELLDKTTTASAEMYRKFVNPKITKKKQSTAYTAHTAPPQPQNTVIAQPPIYQTSTPTPTPTPIPMPTYQSPTPTYQPPATTPTPTPMYQQSSVDGSGTLIDSRDGKKYKTVVIGEHRWMAENLNYQTDSSWCYDNDNSNCNKYGRLYAWNIAKIVCPSGWHLPSRQEWKRLVTVVGDSSIAGKKVKARNGWNRNGNGTDDYGFSALPGGFRAYDIGDFRKIGDNSYWWTATERDHIVTYNSGMTYNGDDIIEGRYYRSGGFSVRCIQD